MAGLYDLYSHVFKVVRLVHLDSKLHCDTKGERKWHFFYSSRWGSSASKSLASLYAFRCLRWSGLFTCTLKCNVISQRRESYISLVPLIEGSLHPRARHVHRIYTFMHLRWSVLFGEIVKCFLRQQERGSPFFNRPMELIQPPQNF